MYSNFLFACMVSETIAEVINFIIFLGEHAPNFGVLPHTSLYKNPLWCIYFFLVLVVGSGHTSHLHSLDLHLM